MIPVIRDFSLEGEIPSIEYILHWSVWNLYIVLYIFFVNCLSWIYYQLMEKLKNATSLYNPDEVSANSLPKTICLRMPQRQQTLTSFRILFKKVEREKRKTQPRWNKLNKLFKTPRRPDFLNIPLFQWADRIFKSYDYELTMTKLILIQLVYCENIFSFSEKSQSGKLGLVNL